MKTRALLCILALLLLILATSCESINISEICTHENTIQTQTIISASGRASFVIHSDGSLWAWGGNSWGQLGDGTTENRHEPVKIMGDVVSVSANGASTMAITSDGGLWAWGGSQIDKSTHVPTKIMDDVVSVSSSGAMAITSNGDLWRISITDPLDSEKIMENVAYASAGLHHAVAVKTDGSLWTWGTTTWTNSNSFGQLGDGTAIDRQYPVKIMEDVIAVSAGMNHSMAVRSDGSLWAWGQNSLGELGDGTVMDRHSPVKIKDDVVSVSVGESHTMAIRSDGSLWAWGDNWHGQLGDGTSANSGTLISIIDANTNPRPLVRVPYRIGTLRDQSDHGTIVDRLAPIKIMEDVVAVSASGFLLSLGEGAAHTLAVRTDGTLWAWGSNSSGQLGDGTTESRLYPIMIHDGILTP